MAKRAPSYRDVRRCELGGEVRCRCRCRGTLHGAWRFGFNPSRWDFEHLPDDDPHKLPQKPWTAKPPIGKLPLFDGREAMRDAGH